MIAIVDYGCGNIKAFANIYRRLAVPFMIARTGADLRAATRVILPGVGAFDHAMQRLEASGMRQILSEMVLARAVPVLGVCVGMQIFADCSEEGDLPGLGWIEGVVRKFDRARLTQACRLPHMGWNDVFVAKAGAALREVLDDGRFYFLHSYHFECRRVEDVLAVTDYGGPFASAVNRRNIFGVQFHPEKSHEWGIRLLRKFASV